MSKDSFKLIANNKKAYHDYFIEDKYEAGIELFGTEGKSIRMGKCSLEIRKLESKIAQKGYTLVPLQVYFKGSLAKVEVGLARGKKLYDKREDIAKKDQKREVQREFKQNLR